MSPCDAVRCGAGGAHGTAFSCGTAFSRGAARRGWGAWRGVLAWRDEAWVGRMVRRSRVARRGVGRVVRLHLISAARTWEVGGNCSIRRPTRRRHAVTGLLMLPNSPFGGRPDGAGGGSQSGVKLRCIPVDGCGKCGVGAGPMVLVGVALAACLDAAQPGWSRGGIAALGGRHAGDTP